MPNTGTRASCKNSLTTSRTLRLKLQGAQKLDLEEQELNAQHGYEAIMQELTDNIENAEAEIARRSKVKAEREQDKADAEKELAQTTADRDEDQKYLDDLKALCAQKETDYDARQKLRAEEIA